MYLEWQGLSADLSLFIRKAFSFTLYICLNVSFSDLFILLLSRKIKVIGFLEHHVPLCNVNFPLMITLKKLCYLGTYKFYILFKVKLHFDFVFLNSLDYILFHIWKQDLHLGNLDLEEISGVDNLGWKFRVKNVNPLN